MRVDAKNMESSPRWSRRRNRRAGDAGSTSEIHDRPALRRRIQLADDVLHEQKVDGSVIQCKRGALAGAVERLAIGQRGLTPLDVGRRQRPQRPRDIAEPQVGEMPFLERSCETGNRQLVNCQLQA